MPALPSHEQISLIAKGSGQSFIITWDFSPEVCCFFFLIPQGNVDNVWRQFTILVVTTVGGWAGLDRE